MTGFHPCGINTVSERRPQAGLLRMPAAALTILCLCSCSSQPVMPKDSAFPKDACRTTSSLAEASGMEARANAIIGLMRDVVARMGNLAPEDADMLVALGKSFVKLADDGLLKSFRAASESGEDVSFASRAALSALLEMEDSLGDISPDFPGAAEALAACRKSAAEIRRIAAAD